MQRTALALFALTFGLFGQSLTSVNGVVTDPSAALIVGARIQLSNVETGARRDTTSDDAGRYVFPQVQPGRYKINASAAGFSEVTIPDVRLLVNSPATINLNFSKMGAVAEAVSVSAEAAMLNTVDASIGNAFSSRPILQLPLEGAQRCGSARAATGRGVHRRKSDQFAQRRGERR